MPPVIYPRDGGDVVFNRLLCAFTRGGVFGNLEAPILEIGWVAGSNSAACLTRDSKIDIHSQSNFGNLRNYLVI